MFAAATVLVVEDDDDIRDVLEDVLTAEGYRVDVAKDGLDALGKLGTRAPPPVILLDMMMPNMDGETFLKALKTRPALAGAPVILISGNPVLRERASKLEAVACLVKPFEMDDLLDLVRQFARSNES